MCELASDRFPSISLRLSEEFDEFTHSSLILKHSHLSISGLIVILSEDRIERNYEREKVRLRLLISECKRSILTDEFCETPV